AFRDNTLGFSKFTTETALPKITEKHVNSYITFPYSYSVRFVVGVSVDHADLVAAVERHFRSGSSTWEKNPDILLPKLPPVDRSIAQYSGGEVKYNIDSISDFPIFCSQILHR
uniref:Peptidase_M16_C domain-containing protein n=1 Tax=Angiostrongylus cantonensis TaxID=6313 RepID=A0A0K0D8P9_ANGCA